MKGDDLVADVHVVEPLAARAIDPLQHEIQEVPRRRGRLSPPRLLALANHLIDRLIHERDVFLKLALRASLQPGLDGQLLNAVHCLAQRADHAVHEGMERLVPERVEAVAEAAERDGVQGVAGGIASDVDIRLRPGALPFGDQLVGDFHHRRKILAQGKPVERRGENAMGLAPVRLVSVGGEEPVVAERAQVLDGRKD
jgi:hypothetical protein